MSVKENIINYKNFRWFWINLFFFSILLAFYLLDHPLSGRGGGTFLGYTYGILATLGIFFLMLFGVRKRSYASTSGTLIGWLSAHLWIGLALILIVPLHSAFQFGMNVHTLSYGFMLVTIFSGMWGAFNYIQFPPQILSNRGGDTARNVLTQIRVIEGDLHKLEEGGSSKLINLIRVMDVPIETKLRQIVFPKKNPIFQVDEHLKKMFADLSASEQEIGVKAMDVVKEKIRLFNIYRDEVGAHFWLKVWLFFHIPLSVGLLVTLAIHIFSVFYYR
ncbi:MAG: hypothetical protein IID17_12625 [Nitrospinae bacterium]|nr:hypothetical protein [Nitrospinota bacterium]